MTDGQFSISSACALACSDDPIGRFSDMVSDGFYQRTASSVCLWRAKILKLFQRKFLALAFFLLREEIISIVKIKIQTIEEGRFEGSKVRRSKSFTRRSRTRRHCVSLRHKHIPTATSSGKEKSP